MIKKLFILSVLMIALQFGCAPVCENEFKSNSGNQQTNENQNQNGDSQTPDDKPKTPITITLVGADGNELKKLEAISGEKVQLSVEIENLSHWNTSRDGSGQSYNGTAVFDESVTLYAILLAENAHTIKYILDDGINNPQNPFSFTEEDYIGIKNPTKAGYTFLGWYDNEDFTGKPIKGWAAGDKTANVTLYAKWQKESDPATEVTITFDINGADVTAPEAITATSGKSVKLPELTGVNFSHWNTSSDDSGLSYKGTATFTESVTLYAILLAENAHTITYELDGGVNNPKNLFSFTEEDYIGIKNPTKTGYTFLGWYDNKNFTGKPIKGWAAGDKTANVTLYAKWEKEPEPAVEVTITFNANGANVKAPEAITSTSVESVKLPALTGVKFSHWNTKADGSGQSYNGTAIFAESVTLYAILLAENAYTITYELNGGVNNPKNKFSFTEDEMVALREPTRDGYKFVGWYETANFSGEAIKIWYEGEKTANVTLYAKWETEESNYETTPVITRADSFTYGFKFCTEYGWAAQFICANATTENFFDKTFVKVGGSANMKTEAGTDRNEYGVRYLDDSTKLFIDSGELVPAKMYTLTYDKKNGTVKLTEAAAGAKATSTIAQEANAEGEFPVGIYINGYLGSNWASDDDAGSALLMDVVDEANEVYAFTWAAPIATITVTLKITMEDTNSTLYLRDVPVKTDGTSAIDGSIYGWNGGMGGSAVTIKNEDGSTITGGIFDAAATATANAEWALTNYVNGNKDVDLAENFGMTGADDVLQLLINDEKWVPYVKGKEVTFSWNNAQYKLSYREPEIISISVNSTNHKTCYGSYESLDVSGLTIEVTRDDGTTRIINVSSSRVSGFDSSVVGTQTLTITYGGCTTTFDIEIEERPTYTITFDANSGSGTMKSQTVGENISCWLNYNTFTAPAGYAFSHWNSKADGSGTNYYSDNSYSFSGNVTLYAQWGKSESSFDVSLPGSTSFSIYQSTDGNYVTFECSDWWFDSYTWYIDGVKQTSTSEEMTVDTSAMKVGIYTVMLKVKNNGTYWSETTTLMVNK